MDMDTQIRVDRSVQGSHDSSLDKTNYGDVEERDLGGEIFRAWCRMTFRYGDKGLTGVWDGF